MKTNKIQSKNIFYESKFEYINYEKKGKPIPKKKYRDDYLEHGEKLLLKLNEIKSNSKEELKSTNGIYLDFISSSNEIINIDGLKNKRDKIELLNVKKCIINEEVCEKATVFIPNNKKDYFKEKITKYKAENFKKDVFSNIENIELSKIESFWVGELTDIPKKDKIWCEVWIKNDSKKKNKQDITNYYEEKIKQLDIEVKEKKLIFEERIVFLCRLNRKDILKLIKVINKVCEIKLNYGLASFYLEEINRSEQFEIISELEQRLNINDEKKASILILDSGVNNEHPLIKKFLKNNDCKGYFSDNLNDKLGHGTKMAGLALYGDLQKILESSSNYKINHDIQSYKICYEVNNNEEFFGSITTEAVLFSKDLKGQINCMAVSSVDNTRSKDGYPSSWSSTIDLLSFGDDNRKEGRLFCLSAGNVPISEAKDYPKINELSHIDDPGQAWNALTIGAYTEKYLENKDLIAQPNTLSPYSKTSLMWLEGTKLIKPEVLFEGGNLYKDQFGPCQPDDLSLLTTCARFDKSLFTNFEATSAATALASNFCARIQSLYPEAWPQTIRGLVVHSAEWTDEIKSQFLPKKPTKGDYSKLLRKCGYGIPNINKALGILQNSTNLIIQEKIVPYKLNDSNNNITFNEFHIHEMPWPKEIFEQLSDKTFQIKITLSYFIEPNPNLSRSIYDYQSFGLRFALSGNRNKDELIKKLSKIDGVSYSDNFQDKWLYGENSRNIGSIHSDIWSGTGAEFIVNNYIAIYPVKGWWKEKKDAGKYSDKVPYSLIVSITSEDEEVDLFTPIYNKIENLNKIEILNYKK